MHGRRRSARYAALLRLPPFFAADLLAPLRAVDFFAVLFFAAPFFAAEPRVADFDALDFFAALFFAAPFAAVLRAPPFDADLLLLFFAALFFAAPFFAVLFFAAPLLALLEPLFEPVLVDGISDLHDGVNRPHGPPVEREVARPAYATRRCAYTASMRHVELEHGASGRGMSSRAPGAPLERAWQRPSRDCR